MFNNKGFTLMEIIIVLTLIGILTAITIPGLKNWQENQRVRSAATGIREALLSAKTTAVKNQTAVRINFTTGTGDSGGYVVFIDDDDNGALDSGEETIRSETMNQLVTLYETPTASERFTGGFTQFNSMGLPIGISAGLPAIFNGSICVRNNNNTIFRKVTLANTGNIIIEKSATGTAGTWIK